MRILNERCLVADDSLVLMVWYKHGFHRRRSNFDVCLYVFEGCGAKELITEFLNKGWGLRELNKLFKRG